MNAMHRFLAGCGAMDYWRVQLALFCASSLCKMSPEYSHRLAYAKRIVRAATASVAALIDGIAQMLSVQARIYFFQVQVRYSAAIGAAQQLR